MNVKRLDDFDAYEEIIVDRFERGFYTPEHAQRLLDKITAWREMAAKRR